MAITVTCENEFNSRLQRRISHTELQITGILQAATPDLLAVALLLLEDAYAVDGGDAVLYLPDGSISDVTL